VSGCSWARVLRRVAEGAIRSRDFCGLGSHPAVTATRRGRSLRRGRASGRRRVRSPGRQVRGLGRRLARRPESPRPGRRCYTDKRTWPRSATTMARNRRNFLCRAHRRSQGPRKFSAPSDSIASDKSPIDREARARYPALIVLQMSYTACRINEYAWPACYRSGPEWSGHGDITGRAASASIDAGPTGKPANGGRARRVPWRACLNSGSNTARSGS
jgi:hypothetical protein